MNVGVINVMMKTNGLLSVVFSVNLILQTAWGFAGENLGIYGGHDIPIETAPYMVALFIPKTDGRKTFCGGSIIHKKFVLTAAHCLRNSTVPFSAWGFVGTDNLNNRDRRLIKFDKKICYKDFIPSPYNYNDICILKLKKPLKYGSKIARVALPDEAFELEAGTLVNVTGWGDTETSDTLGSLRLVTIPIVPKDYCPITDRYICAGTQGHGTCYGDSGGPLMYNNIQIGVVSHHPLGGECAGAYGTMYTSVASFAKWIGAVIRNNVP